MPNIRAAQCQEHFNRYYAPQFGANALTTISEQHVNNNGWVIMIKLALGSRSSSSPGNPPSIFGNGRDKSPAPQFIIATGRAKQKKAAKQDAYRNLIQQLEKLDSRLLGIRFDGIPRLRVPPKPSLDSGVKSPPPRITPDLWPMLSSHSSLSTRYAWIYNLSLCIKKIENSLIDPPKCFPMITGYDFALTVLLPLFNHLGLMSFLRDILAEYVESERSETPAWPFLQSFVTLFNEYASSPERDARLVLQFNSFIKQLTFKGPPFAHKFYNDLMYLVASQLINQKNLLTKFWINTFTVVQLTYECRCGSNYNNPDASFSSLQINGKKLSGLMGSHLTDPKEFFAWNVLCEKCDKSDFIKLDVKFLSFPRLLLLRVASPEDSWTQRVSSWDQFRGLEYTIRVKGLRFDLLAFYVRPSSKPDQCTVIFRRKLDSSTWWQYDSLNVSKIDLAYISGHHACLRYVQMLIYVKID